MLWVVNRILFLDKDVYEVSVLLTADYRPALHITRQETRLNIKFNSRQVKAVKQYILEHYK